MAAQRQSNIELCRLFSILLVMLVHTTFQSLGHDVSLGVRMLEGFSIIGVNVFILITGYFSVTPKKTSLVNLAFICLFWMIIKVICRFAFGESVTIKHLFFITSSNWFIASYIGILFLSPVLNIYCNTVNKRTLWGGIFLLFTIEIWFDWLPPFPESRIGAKGGYSIFSFEILYLLARAIRIYGLPQWFKKYSLLIYIVCSLCISILAHLGDEMGFDLSVYLFPYINPIVIVSSVAFLIFFEKVKLQSKLVNHIARSTLAVLLGHTAIFFLYTKQFKYIYEHYSGVQVVVYWVLSIVLVFCASITIDQLRLIIYKPLKKLMEVKIKNNNIFDLPDCK